MVVSDQSSLWKNREVRTRLASGANSLYIAAGGRTSQRTHPLRRMGPKKHPKCPRKFGVGGAVGGWVGSRTRRISRVREPGGVCVLEGERVGAGGGGGMGPPSPVLGPVGFLLSRLCRCLP